MWRLPPAERPVRSRSGARRWRALELGVIPTYIEARGAAGPLQGPRRGCLLGAMGEPRRGRHPRLRRHGCLAGDADVQDGSHSATPDRTAHGLARYPVAPSHPHGRNAIADHREHCLIPLLHDTQLHQRARECVADQAEPASPFRRGVSPLRRSQDLTRQAEPDKFLVAPAGIEPATHGLGNRCSIPLSYEASPEKSTGPSPAIGRDRSGEWRLRNASRKSGGERSRGSTACSSP
jgi:hypothetical protein